ncbi:cyclophilin-like fold protein [Gulosibacter sp. 10]|uniref:cyclophilin-like fold protein n=1 Tax=Gulosibacter sp. 10 TaxID=1255570 RepID=UPI00097E8A29|nr:cyclophilin-like fold protein [Gulosibacter sp. 10]SJM70070.1 Conserved domain protein precursor [Gulosibacter sp. 10]
MSETPIRIRIDDQVLEARLWDNPAARDLIDQLPLTLDFSDYGGQEVLAEPPRPLTTEWMPSGESAPAGTIGWYAPGNAIVLYYADVGAYNGIMRIGAVEGDLSILRGWDDDRPVVIELAE